MLDSDGWRNITGLSAIGAMYCVRAFRDGLLARIADAREISSWLHLYQATSLAASGLLRGSSDGPGNFLEV